MSARQKLVFLWFITMFAIATCLLLFLPQQPIGDPVILTTIGMDINSEIVTVNRVKTFPDMDSCLLTLHQKGFTDRLMEISYCDPQGDPR